MNRIKNKTVRSMVLDFVEANGPQTYNTLHKVVLTVTGQPLTRNNYGSSYLDQVSCGSACVSNRNDDRILVKEKDGLYHLYR